MKITRNIIRLLTIISLMSTIMLAGCFRPPNGVGTSKEILIKDTGYPVNTEAEASNLVIANLDIISGADLVRIDGPIDSKTLVNVTASKMEGNQFLVNIEYTYKESKTPGDNGKVAVTVTGEGKIYGIVRLQPN
jgi:hypothetical protein